MKSNTEYKRKGITLIELSIVTGIAAAMMAMILGLARHVTTNSNIRRTQSELGAWHLAMDNWHDIFGEYPGDIIREDGSRDTTLDGTILNNLQNVYNDSGSFFYHNNSMTGLSFRSCCTHPVKIKDPWGTPYIYLRDAGRQSYELFSCGPDAETEYLNSGIYNHDTNLDDIFFVR